MPIIVRYLLDEYSFSGAALIMGALAFHGIVGAALFQPVEWHMKHFDGDDDDGMCFSEKKMLLQPCRHSLNQHTYDEVITDADDNDDDNDDLVDNKSAFISNDTMSIDSEAILIRKPSWKRRIYKALDLQLLIDPIFISIAIGLALAYTASINFSMIFPYFLQVCILESFVETVFIFIDLYIFICRKQPI